MTCALFCIWSHLLSRSAFEALSKHFQMDPTLLIGPH